MLSARVVFHLRDPIDQLYSHLKRIIWKPNLLQVWHLSDLHMWEWALQTHIG